MRLVVKIIGKDIVSNEGKFTAYSMLTSKGNWYRTAKIDPKELEKFKGEVAAVEVSRRFDKKVEVKGEEREYPTLVVESIEAPTDKELKEYTDKLQELNNETLKDVE